MITDFPFSMLTPESEELDGLHERPQEERQASMTSAYQPIIGMPIPAKQSPQGPVLLADAVGAWAVERMGARVLLIPFWPFPTHQHLYHSLWSLVQSMDGLFLPASVGADWYPAWKEGRPESGHEHWPMCWEMGLAQLATFLGMPVLAIGDGAEQWNSALGGKRGETPRDPAHRELSTPETWERQTIRVRAQSALATVLQHALTEQEDEQKSWELAVMPQQGVERVASGLRSCAQSEDGRIMAFERRDGVFGLGILGRLDWGLDQRYGSALFEAFLRACHAFDRKRQQARGWEADRETICATVAERVAQGQPLIDLPKPPPSEEKRARTRPLAPAQDASSGSGGRARVRQRSSQPSKQELNDRRRQRLKGTTR